MATLVRTVKARSSLSARWKSGVWFSCVEAMAAVKCPVLMVLGDADQMTTPKGAQPLIKHAKENGIDLKVVMVPHGHHQMSESPDETLDALKAFLRIA